jgi:hypothetical protein
MGTSKLTILSSILYLVGSGVFVVAGSILLPFFALSVILYIVGSLIFTFAGILDFVVFVRILATQRLPIVFNQKLTVFVLLCYMVGGVLFLIGSVLTYPYGIDWIATLGNWVFVLGPSFFIIASSILLWKISSQIVEDELPDQLQTECLVNPVASRVGKSLALSGYICGSLCFIIGGTLFQLDNTTQGSICWFAAGWFFLFGACASLFESLRPTA